MQQFGGSLVLAVSDLVGHLACEHRTQLELAAARDQMPRPARRDPEIDLVTRRGTQHEQAFLAHLRAQGKTIVDLGDEGSHTPTTSLDDLRAADARTLEAVRTGADVVYQASFFDGRWRGRADFLLRVETPSALGSWSYEVADTKLARRVKPDVLLQMCAYSEQLERLQGAAPEKMHVVLGDMTEHVFRLVDYAAYYRTVKDDCEAAAFGAPRDTYPDPVEHCTLCNWAEVCEAKRRADDHLSLVPNLRRDQTRKLGRAGITTVAALAASPDDGKVRGMQAQTLDRLRGQARLQVRQRETGRQHYEILSPDGPGRGLAALPPPSPGDLFFDMEGDPYVEGGGLEYLFGVVEIAAGEPCFTPIWAHDRAAEKQAFERFVDLVVERLELHPDLHVYHYAPYEPTALKRLMGAHATREAEIDRLLRGGVLVDLYQVVRQGLRVSCESYSIKQLEAFYMDGKREGAIRDAGSSIVAYEDWIESQEAKLLQDIADYNEDDCVSTWKLRDWLEARRDEARERFGDEALPRPEPQEGGPSESLAQVDEETRILVERLTDGVPADAARRDPEEQARWLLAQLLGWHRREEKPEWWAYFHRKEMSDDELVEDSEAIGGLEYERDVGREARTVVERYRFDPAQEHKILKGDKPLDSHTDKPAGKVIDVDSRRGSLDLLCRRLAVDRRPTALVPGKPIPSKAQQGALRRVATWVVEHGIVAPGPHAAVRELLLGNAPRGRGVRSGDPLRVDGETTLAAARRLALSLDSATLAVQGPPGSGKTYTGAHVILDLVEARRKVGITAMSHKAIGNLLAAVWERADERGIRVRGIQRAPEESRTGLPELRFADKNEEVDDALLTGQVDIVAGTQWLFAREELAGALDTLVVDEAGQMSLANVVAMGGAARNVILLGDPRQLAQPSKGSHPPGAERSALEHLLGEHATMPPDRGLFLETTWRMHPNVCAFISEIVYESRLESDDSCARQALGAGNPLGGEGLRHLPVEHRGNRTVSDEEVECVAREVVSLLGRRWIDAEGGSRALVDKDILVVSPYNAQVARLVADPRLNTPIGTVDKFQGQEAPVVFFSMATSSAEDLPRDMEFLYSLNRLNVAISRARGLAVLVCSPALLRVRCRTPEQMRLANALCRLVEMAHKQTRQALEE